MFKNFDIKCTSLVISLFLASLLLAIIPVFPYIYSGLPWVLNFHAHLYFIKNQEQGLAVETPCVWASFGLTLVLRFPNVPLILAAHLEL